MCSTLSQNYHKDENYTGILFMDILFCRITSFLYYFAFIYFHMSAYLLCSVSHIGLSDNHSSGYQPCPSYIGQTFELFSPMIPSRTNIHYYGKLFKLLHINNHSCYLVFSHIFNLSKLSPCSALYWVFFCSLLCMHTLTQLCSLHQLIAY